MIFSKLKQILSQQVTKFADNIDELGYFPAAEEMIKEGYRVSRSGHIIDPDGHLVDEAAYNPSLMKVFRETYAEHENIMDSTKFTVEIVVKQPTDDLQIDNQNISPPPPPPGDNKHSVNKYGGTNKGRTL